jgi:transposase
MDEKHLRLIPGIGAEDWERTPASVRQLVVQLGLKIEQLEQHLKELQSSNEQMTEKVNRNSENSHSPPASDPPNVEKTKKKKPTGKKRGGQPGHPGHSRPLYPVEECALVSDYSERVVAIVSVLSGMYRHSQSTRARLAGPTEKVVSPLEASPRWNRQPK